MQGVECVEQIKELVLAQCEKACPHSVTEQLEKVLNDTTKPVGLLLSERFINVPPQIALPLHKQLQWVAHTFAHYWLIPLCNLLKSHSSLNMGNSKYILH